MCRESVEESVNLSTDDNDTACSKTENVSTADWTGRSKCSISSELPHPVIPRSGMHRPT